MNVSSSNDSKLERLRNISIFGDLRDDADAMHILADLFSTYTVEAGTAVITEGDAGDALFIIGSGTVEIVKSTRQGDPYTVAELSAEMNIFFGEMALLDLEKRSATVLCKTDCVFYVLSRDDFIQLGDTHSHIGLCITRELSKIICKRLRKANVDIIVLFDALVEEVTENGGII